MSEVNLKPCPFCDGEALSSTLASGSPLIQCVKCQAIMIGPDAAYALTLANKWNTREPGWKHIDTHPTGSCMPIQFLVYTTNHNIYMALSMEGDLAYLHPIDGLTYDYGAYGEPALWRPLPSEPKNATHRS